MRVIDSLQGGEGNYILPFFWQHGESEKVLREYMNAIRNANITEVCLEARPHPDFAGEQWFHDVDIILDEAKKLGMKLWILDDAHFPSGQAGGKFAQEPDRLHKIFLNYNVVDTVGPAKQVTLDVESMAHYYENPFAGEANAFFQGAGREFTDPEKLFAVVAGRLDGKYGDMYHLSELIDLTDRVTDGVLIWDVPEGSYRIFVIYETHKGGGRVESVNFLSRESCRVQIQNCYESHWQRYREEFGKTILGFFSDEPEVGNAASYDSAAGRIGNPSMPLPWSEEMPALMENRFGKDYRCKVVALWNTAVSDEFTCDMRVGYMDIVTRLCQKNFGEQMGEWCRERGVKYIGHIVEDNDASPNLASSQGHFFRALWGQDWSGIDTIGGQITLNGADKSHKGFTGTGLDGEFFHHELTKLGTSLADIDPKKQGVTLCEAFGAYGWEEGTRLMKYIMDHLLVRGVNRFVPHAFSPKEFPDFDCPPHFYAHGKNPLYKPFGSLMKYTNRLSHMISGGFHEVRVAVLYHAESEWSGLEYMDMGKVGRFLDDAQIDFDYIPADVFAEPEKFASFFDKEGLHINGHIFETLIIPGAAYITKETENFVRKALAADYPILFAGRVPDRLKGEVTATRMEDLADKITEAGISDVSISPSECDIQIYHYVQGEEAYYLINNESNYKRYRGILALPVHGTDGKIYRYDGVVNRLYRMPSEKSENKLFVEVEIVPYDMLVLVRPLTKQQQETLDAVSTDPVVSGAVLQEVTGEWKVSFCLNEEYPDFKDERSLEELVNINMLKKDWSGVIAYKNQVELSEAEANCAARIEVEDAYESLELWVNGAYAGERFAPPYSFDVTGLMKAGKNEIRFECRTTLERLVHGITGGKGLFGPEFIAVNPSGMIGKVVVR